MAAKQQAEMALLREQTNAEMKASAEETRRHIESVNQLLKDAISKRAADVFMTDEEVAKLNEQKVNQLAEAIAAKVMPYGSNIPKTPEEAEKLQNEQVDKVSSRMAEKISPILSEMAKDQNLTRESINAYSQRITDQISGVLTGEMSRNQQLNTQLLASQAVAQDSMKLSHEITALYLSSFKDQGLLTRLLTLPANVVRDATSISIVNSSDRKKIEERLVPQLDVAFLVDAFGVAQELVVAAKVIGRDTGDLAAQRCFVVGIIEADAIGPVEPVERHHRHQFDILAHVLPGQGPQFLETRRIGDDGRPGIEGEALAFPDVGTAAHLVARFDQCRRHASRLQADRQRQAAEAGPDNAGALHVVLPSDASGRPRPSRLAMAAPSGTGGLPARIRAMSAGVDRPA